MEIILSEFEIRKAIEEKLKKKEISIKSLAGDITFDYKYYSKTVKVLFAKIITSKE